MRDLRVVTWNMYMWGVETGEPVDPTMHQHVKYINEVLVREPDIIFVQEIDQNAVRTNRLDQLQRLAQTTGLTHTAYQALPGVETIAGVGILSRFPLTEIKTVNVALEGRPSNTVIATAMIDGESVRLYSNHWPTRPEKEYLGTIAATLLLPLIQSDVLLGRRVIFGGDLNAYVGDPPVRSLSPLLKDCLTIADSAPTWFANCTKDHILFNGSFRVKQCLVDKSDLEGILLSDHPIIVADLTDGVSRTPKIWCEQNTGFLQLFTPDRIVFDIVPGGSVNPATVEFELQLHENVTDKKSLTLPDGEGNSKEIVAEGKDGLNRNSIRANQVKNGQSLTFARNVSGKMVEIATLGQLESIKPGTKVIFHWTKD